MIRILMIRVRWVSTCGGLPGKRYAVQLGRLSPEGLEFLEANATPCF